MRENYDILRYPTPTVWQNPMPVLLLVCDHQRNAVKASWHISRLFIVAFVTQKSIIHCNLVVQVAIISGVKINFLYVHVVYITLLSEQITLHSQIVFIS